MSASRTAFPRCCFLALAALAACSSGAGGNGPSTSVTPPALVSPQPNSVIKSSQLFEWSAGADEVWLRVGSTEGAADLFESASLGHATQQRVVHLPLNGAPIYVELRSRIGDQTFSTAAVYQASFRRGLCLIADFADARLEDWTGDGFKSLDDVRWQLTEMEKHWNWISRGREIAHWDIVRVPLTEELNADAFTGNEELRDRVVSNALKTLSASDYDVDDDGVIDGVWIIVPDQARPLPWLIGGESPLGGANVFVDGQSGGSVTGKQTGNFNHEFGHCMGLPDLYGPFGTVVGMTLMASSWDMPPNDFSAFDRLKLGWLNPQVIRETTRHVRLRPANDAFDAVLVPTPRSMEYFLLEYRKTPTDGYGSMSPAYNGLAVLHALDRSTQKLNPPLLKTEPVDGAIVPDTAPELDDLLFPGNPKMQLPFAVRSHVGGQTIFEIDNVAWVDGGIEFDVIVSPLPPIANLLPDASFEGGGEPWRSNPDDEAIDFAIQAPGRAGGSDHCAFIDSHGEPVVASWRQRVSDLTPGTAYLLCGWLRGEEVVFADPLARAGATVSVLGGIDPSGALTGTFGWTQYCTAFSLPSAMSVDIGCRLGGVGSPASGRIWCDDLTLEALQPAYQ